MRGPGGHAGRGLCSSCGGRAARDGTLDDYPRLTRPHGEVLAELRARRHGWPGASVAQLADAMGMTYAALEIAIRRARAAGELV